jgi:hypothetical protein
MLNFEKNWEGVTKVKNKFMAKDQKVSKKLRTRV